MKYLSFLLLFAFSINAFAQKAPELKTQQDSASYAFAVLISQNIKRQLSFEVNNEVFATAMSQAMNNAPLLMTPEKANEVYTAYNQAQTMKAGEAARTAGEKFLEENKKRKEVKTTASGLQYEVIKQGAGGAKPAATDNVSVHYHGTLIDGSVFDSSVERGQPAQFGLNQVISGWTEGLQLMSVGDKFKFYLPYNLAYGERSAGAKIKPFSALVFEVELLDIKNNFCTVF